ncbi:MAG: TerB N-terminal domain-containing protein [Drouetiella hepatica Uher 2000/2452]|jgi:uncharacterized tellurite resistance protein B-like protein|uniref:TerB N-terminal domain-containing protein n=1 Tax=Drouetiella hepatica Uher 2000/2452 TaxID=904376 RepID=A0A951QA96_9CYAN|nr:TerB N-terminal domain-containing protein [Drouetiella hepatica Uher 2000/2452]
MEFRPFWELLADLGIALPEPDKLKGKILDRLDPSRTEGKSEPQRMKSGRASRRTNAMPVSPQELIDFFSELEFEERLAGRTERMEPSRNQNGEWIPPDETVTVAGYEIPGMVYVGEDLAAINNSRASETSLINPQLKVKRDRPDHEGKQMPYSTSYSQMPPACRAAYLQWLSTGRNAPNTYIGYIWLFFYGLERRVFHDLLRADLKNDAVRQELDQIVAEVERLNKVYGGNSLSGGIRYKTETFLETCQVMRSADLSKTIDPMTAKALPLQVGLGQLVAQGQPIPANWALAWYMRLANLRMPTAATRCPDEFQALFQLRYSQQYGDGMKLKSGKSKLTTAYYPASQSFWSRSVTVPIGNLPDVTRFAAKIKKIGEVVETCRVELEPLSRYLGRNPKGRETHGAIALLPAELLATHGGKVVQKLQKWLDKIFPKPENQIAVVSGADLLKQWLGANLDKLTRAEAAGLAKFLELLGYGMEPDVRLGGTPPTLKNSIALFRLDSPSLLALSNEYLEATLLAHLAIFVANGDESPSAAEQQCLQKHLADWVTLEAPERSRLDAHVQVLLSEQPTLRGLKARVERTEPKQRGAIAQFALRVAAADGQLSPKEVQLLEKVYLLLELDPQTLYSDIHGFSTAVKPAVSHDPVTVRQAAATVGHSIPPKPKKGEPAAFALDMALVQSKLVESQEISELLAEIFVDEGEVLSSEAAGKSSSGKVASGKAASGTKAQKKRKAAPEIAGLDASHSALLMALAQQPVWQREQLESIAAQYHLMLDGALEVINEAAFDRSDEPVTEGHDSIEVNTDVLREMLS